MRLPEPKPLRDDEFRDYPLNHINLYNGWLYSLIVMTEVLRVMRRLCLTLDTPTRERIITVVTRSRGNLHQFVIPWAELRPAQAIDWQVSVDRNPVSSHEAAPYGIELGRLRVLHWLQQVPNHEPLDGRVIFIVIERAWQELLATFEARDGTRDELIDFAGDLYGTFDRFHHNDTEQRVIEDLHYPLDAVGHALHAKAVRLPHRWTELNLARAMKPTEDFGFRCLLGGTPAFRAGWQIGNIQLVNIASGWLGQYCRLDMNDVGLLAAELELQRHNHIALTITGIHTEQPIEELRHPHHWVLAAGILAGRRAALHVLFQERVASRCDRIIDGFAQRLNQLCELDMIAQFARYEALGAIPSGSHTEASGELAELLAIHSEKRGGW